MYDFLYNIGDRVISAYPAWLNNILCDAPDAIYLLTMQEEIVGVEAIILVLLLLAGIIWKINTFIKKATYKPKKTKTQKPVNVVKQPATKEHDISEKTVTEEPSVIGEKTLSPNELKQREHSLKVILDVVGEDEYNAHKKNYDHIVEVGCIREDGKFYDTNHLFFHSQYKKWIAYNKLGIEPDYKYAEIYIRENALLYEKLYPEEAKALSDVLIVSQISDILAKDLAEKIVATLNGEDKITDEDIERYRTFAQHDCSLQAARQVWQDLYSKVYPDNYQINRELDECERTGYLGDYLRSISNCQERIHGYEFRITKLKKYQGILSNPPVTQVMEEAHLLEMYSTIEKYIKQNESVISRLNNVVKMVKEREKTAQTERAANTYEPADFNDGSYSGHSNRGAYEDTYNGSYNDNSYSSDDDSSYNSFGGETESYASDPPSNNNNDTYNDYSDYWHDNNGWSKGLSGDPDEDQYYYQ